MTRLTDSRLCVKCIQQKMIIIYHDYKGASTEIRKVALEAVSGLVSLIEFRVNTGQTIFILHKSVEGMQSLDVYCENDSV